MCSILGIFDIRGDASELRRKALDLSRLQRHRGPDWSGCWEGERAILAHERLAIVDVEHGAQPLVSPDGDLVLAVNGEIYNHQILREHLSEWPTTSCPYPSTGWSRPMARTMPSTSSSSAVYAEK